MKTYIKILFLFIIVIIAIKIININLNSSNYNNVTSSNDEISFFNSQITRLAIHETGHLMALLSSTEKLYILKEKYGVYFPYATIIVNPETGTSGSVWPLFTDKDFHKKIMLENDFSDISEDILLFLIKYLAGGFIAEQIFFKNIFKPGLKIDTKFITAIKSELKKRIGSKRTEEEIQNAYNEISKVLIENKENFLNITSKLQDKKTLYLHINNKTKEAVILTEPYIKS